MLELEPASSSDGIPGEEGAFLLCSFWLADNLVGQGRLDEAEDLYASLCARASPSAPLSLKHASGGLCLERS
jgi:GH15 family glucan-1,4-alpha-glucosidase